MKRAVLLHGTDGRPDDLWFPWLQKQLESAGYHVYSPLLPNNHTPNKETYDSFLKESGWDFKDNILIGHSSGATTALNLLMSDWFPKVKATVLVGVFLNEKLLPANAEWYQPGQFDELFPDSFNIQNIKNKGGKLYFVHGTDDPYCDVEDAKKLSQEVSGTFIEISKGHHLASSSGIKELPQITETLKSDNLL